jgi:hypothetical protein
MLRRSPAAVTPGGHIVNDDLVAIGASHRKLANPLPMVSRRPPAPLRGAR